MSPPTNCRWLGEHSAREVSRRFMRPGPAGHVGLLAGRTHRARPSWPSSCLDHCRQRRKKPTLYENLMLKIIVFQTHGLGEILSQHVSQRSLVCVPELPLLLGELATPAMQACPPSAHSSSWLSEHLMFNYKNVLFSVNT